MISITLQFATMQEAADALARFTPTTAAAAVQATAAIEKAKVEAPKAQAPAATQAAPVTATPTPVATAAAAPAAESPSEALSYDVVSKAITDKVKSNRDHVVATLAKFGVKKGTELKAEQYSEFLAAL